MCMQSSKLVCPITFCATYFEAIQFYKNLYHSSPKVLLKEMGMTDAGYPLHLVLVSNDGKFDPAIWHKQNKFHCITII